MAKNTTSNNSPTSKSKSYATRFFTTVLVLYISFIAVNLTHQLIQAGVSKVLGYKTTVNFVRVDSSPKTINYWSGNRVMALYAMPVAFFLVLCIFCFVLLEIRKSKSYGESESKQNGLISLFLFWLGLCLYNAAVAQLIISPIGRLNPDRNFLFQDFSVVANWYGFSTTVSIVITAVSFIVSLLLGYYTGKHFYKNLAFSSQVLTRSGALAKFMWWLYLLPVLLLAPVVVLLTFPMPPFLHLVQVGNLLWMGLGVYSYVEQRKAKLILKKNEQDTANRESKDLLIVLVILLVVIKLILRY